MKPKVINNISLKELKQIATNCKNRNLISLPKYYYKHHKYDLQI